MDSRAFKEFQSKWRKMVTRTSEGREAIEGAAPPASAVWLILFTKKRVSKFSFYEKCKVRSET